MGRSVALLTVETRLSMSVIISELSSSSESTLRTGLNRLSRNSFMVLDEGSEGSGANELKEQQR